jgi:hypothetical protein
MDEPFDISHYHLYKFLTDKDLLVAISNENEKRINELLEIYKTIDKIPSSKTVRGIFVRTQKNDLPKISTASALESDITVNQLLPFG